MLSKCSGADSIFLIKKQAELPGGTRFALQVARSPYRSPQPVREPKNRKFQKFRDFPIFANNNDCIHDVCLTN